jgi:phosphatidylglycerophosphate synthase
VRIRVNFRPNLDQLFYPFTRSHAGLCDADNPVCKFSRKVPADNGRRSDAPYLWFVCVLFSSAHYCGDLLSVATTVMPEASSEAIDRRPIATRNRKWAQEATTWLASRNVSPNAISIAGMCACIVAGIALGMTSIADYRILWLIAAAGAQLRLTANMLDGMVAIASSRTSKTGELYNEVPDRVSDAAVFIGAGFAWGGNVTLGYTATILAILTAYVRAAGKIAGAPNEFCGPMAKQHRMLVITLVCLYSAFTPRSWQMIAFNDSQIGLITLGLVVIVVGCVITVIRRVGRIAHALGA